MPPDRKDLASRARRVLSPVLGRYTWLELDHAEGSWLSTTDGRRYLDLTCGIAVLNAGHSHPKVVAAVREQAGKYLHISTGVMSYEPNIAYAEALSEVTPPGFDTFFFANSGAEAIEAAIKMSRQVTGRQGIIAFRGGFHGRTTGATAITTSKAKYRDGYAPLLPEVYIAPYPYPLRCGHAQPHTAEECGALCLRELELMFAHEVSPTGVAAAIIEPVLGEGGYVPPPESFLRGLRDLTKKHGILLVFDEVQCGFGRTGAMFAAQRYGVTPDALALAKALGGGLPLGALVSPRELQAKWHTGSHGSTFGGNPLACTAGMATLSVIREERLVERADAIGDIIVEELRPIAKQPGVAEIRRIGCMVGVEFADESGAPDPEAAKNACKGAIERGVLIITAGSFEQVVRFMPALNIAEEDLRKGVRAFVEAVKRPVAAAAH